MDTEFVCVEGWRYRGDRLDLSNFGAALGLALDQRRFGPRRLLVVTCDLSGGVLGLAHCQRTDPPELGLICCLAELDDGARAAVAYSDETVEEGPPGLDLTERFWAARAAALERHVHLVDWIICDDLMLRSIKLGLDRDGDNDDEAGWWDLPISSS